MGHLDELKPPGNLGEGRMDDQLPRRPKRAIGAAGQVGKMLQKPR